MFAHAGDHAGARGCTIVERVGENVEFLHTLSHDVLRVTDLLPATAPDEAIV